MAHVLLIVGNLASRPLTTRDSLGCRRLCWAVLCLQFKLSCGTCRSIGDALFVLSLGRKCMCQLRLEMLTCSPLHFQSLLQRLDFFHLATRKVGVVDGGSRRLCACLWNKRPGHYVRRNPSVAWVRACEIINDLSITRPCFACTTMPPALEVLRTRQRRRDLRHYCVDVSASSAKIRGSD